MSADASKNGGSAASGREGGGAAIRPATLTDFEGDLAQLQAIFDGTYQYIGLLTPDGTMIRVNRAALEFAEGGFGSRIEDVTNRPFWETIWFVNTPGAPERLEASIKQAAQGEFIRYEAPLLRPSGEEEVFDFSLHPVHDESGKVIFIVPEGRIITDRKRAEAALQKSEARYRVLFETMEQQVAERTAELMRAEEQLRQSQKMEAVGQLTGGLAHDFNNLLQGISGALERMAVLMREGRLPEVDRYMVGAQGAARRAAALTHRLLAFSRRQTLDPRPTDVNLLVIGLTDMIQRSVGPAISIDAIRSPDLWPVLVDPSQLENAILNLCINSRDAMPDGGRIDIEIANLLLDAETARGLDLSPGPYVSLSVTDTGSGMDPTTIAKAFDPFFTTKPLGQGTGLGLSMIYGFAKQSGGQVRIKSEIGHGTKVCIYLPRYEGAAAAEAPRPMAGTHPHAGSGQCVLVVDDEATVRMLLVDIVEGLGFTAIEAQNGQSGVEVLRSDARIDLLITDVGLPGGLNGRQLADAALETRPSLKVLFITGYAETSVIADGQLGPGMGVLTKPFELDSLVTRIGELMGEDPSEG